MKNYYLLKTIIKAGLFRNVLRYIFFQNKDIQSKVLKKVVVFSIYGIGNSVLSIPLLIQIKRDNPLCKIIYIYTDKIAIQIIPKHLIDFSIHYNESNKGSFIFKMLKLKAGIVFYLFPTKNVDLLEISSIIRSKYRIGYNNIRYKFLTHKLPIDTEKPEWLLNLELYLQLFKPKCKLSYNEPIITYEDLTDFDNNSINYVNKPYICIHPGAGAKEKQWPLDSFINLINEIKNNLDRNICLVGGPSEEHLGDRIQGECPFVMNLIGTLSIQQTAFIIKYSEVFISNDSGLMHIAGAVGIPQIAIFGPTPIQKNRPWGNQKYKIFLRSDCPPCYSDGRFNCSKKTIAKCLKDITPEIVYDSLIKLLSIIQ